MKISRLGILTLGSDSFEILLVYDEKEVLFRDTVTIRLKTVTYGAWWNGKAGHYLDYIRFEKHSFYKVDNHDFYTDVIWDIRKIMELREEKKKSK